MEEKKIQEEKESIPEFDQDKEPFQENEKVNSEEEIVGNEDKKTTEESTGENDKAEDGTQSEAREKDTSEKVVSISALRNMFGKEVTWAAVAALGGAAIVIWNIIRYIFLLCSSYIVHSITKVPIYLLMIRRNVGFTDGYIFYGTIIVLCTLINPLRFLNIRVRKKIAEVISFCSMIVFLIASYCIVGDGDSIFLGYEELIKLKIIFVYISPVVLMPFVDQLYLANELYNLRKRKKPVKHEKATAKSQGMMSEEKKQNQRGNDLLIGISVIKKYITSERKIPLVIHLFCYVIVIILLIMIRLMPTEGLLDQYGRFIVADLGEQYIVQPATYDYNNHLLMLDTSRYYVVDSGNESIKEIEFLPVIFQTENLKNPF